MSKKMMVWIFLGLVGLWIASQLFKTSVVVDGDKITIDKAGHHIEGVLAPENRYEFILIGAEAAFNTFSGDGFVTALPLIEAQTLQIQYGDFLQIDSPGAAEAKKLLQPTVLLAKDAPVKATLAEALGLIKQENNPVFAFSGSRIDITKHTFLRMVTVNDDSGTKLYYLQACEIIKPNYQ